MIEIQSEKCTRCGLCVKACPEMVFEERPGQAPAIVRESLCIDCGHCVAICPGDAVLHAAYPAESVHALDRAQLPTLDQLLGAMRARRSVRLYDKRAVERGHLEQIIEAARCAPTAHNFQPTEYLVIQDAEKLREICARTVAFLDKARKQLRNPVLRALFGLIAPDELRASIPMLPCFDRVVEEAARGGDRILHHAPCLLLFHADSGRPYANENTQLGLQNATLAAGALGLGSFYTGYVVAACRREKALTTFLEIPPSHHVYAGMTLGYSRHPFPKTVARKPAVVRWT